MTHSRDIDLPQLNDDGDHDVETVGQLIRTCKKQVEDNAMRYLAEAELNEKMIAGEQFVELSTGFEIQDITDWPSFVPRAPRNLLRNLSLTWSSRIVEDDPWVQCFPNEPGIDQIRTQVSQKVLEQCRQTHDFRDLLFRAAQLVQPHTCVGFKVCWDPLRGPPSKGFPVVDELGQEVMEGAGLPTGDVCWEIVTIYDYGTDGAEEIEDSKWCYFTKMVDEFDARSLLASAGIDEPPNVENYTDVWGSKRSGVQITEFWHRPDYRFPKGIFAIMVGEHVLQALPYPYNHMELPLCVWKCGSRRNSPFGSSHVSDAIYIQRAINEAVAGLQQQARIMAGIKLLAHSSIVAQIQAGNQMINADDPALAQGVRYLEAPPRSEVLVQTLEDNVQALYAVYGLNEMLSGAENVKAGTSAKSIAYLNKLDSMKMAGASRSLQKAILRLTRQTLKLFQQYVQAPRLAQIAGDQGEFAANEFIGADLAGVDVKLESASALEQMRGQVAGDAMMQQQAGNPDPALGEIAATGIKDTSYAKASRDVVMAQAEAALQGQAQAIDQEVDANVAVQTLIQIWASNHQNPQAAALLELLRGYQQKVTQMQVQPEMAAGGEQ